MTDIISEAIEGITEIANGDAKIEGVTQRQAIDALSFLEQILGKPKDDADG